MKQQLDLLVIGGGVGLMTAWFARRQGASVAVIERATVGNRAAGSTGLTRSFRCDYEDPLYARLAAEARREWINLESRFAETFLINCGCLNLRKNALGGASPCYGERSTRTLQQCGLPATEFDRAEASERFPQFSVDAAYLDPSGGILLADRVVQTLRRELPLQGVQIEEGSAVLSIAEGFRSVRVGTARGVVECGALSICAGVWTNSVLELIASAEPLPIAPARPRTCRYYTPASKIERFCAPALPVFACLEFGIYAHPIVPGVTSSVRIGQYLPPGASAREADRVGVDRFVRECLPTLVDAAVSDVVETDQGAYEMTPDGDFFLGRLPRSRKIAVAAGFCGTGFKFAPLVGSWMASTALGARDPVQRWSLDRLSIGGQTEPVDKGELPDERRKGRDSFDHAP